MASFLYGFDKKKGLGWRRRTPTSEPEYAEPIETDGKNDNDVVVLRFQDGITHPLQALTVAEYKDLRRPDEADAGNPIGDVTTPKPRSCSAQASYDWKYHESRSDGTRVAVYLAKVHGGKFAFVFKERKQDLSEKQMAQITIDSDLPPERFAEDPHVIALHKFSIGVVKEYAAGTLRDKAAVVLRKKDRPVRSSSSQSQGHHAPKPKAKLLAKPAAAAAKPAAAAAKPAAATAVEGRAASENTDDDINGDPITESEESEDVNNPDPVLSDIDSWDDDMHSTI